MTTLRKLPINRPKRNVAVPTKYGGRYSIRTFLVEIANHGSLFRVFDSSIQSDQWAAINGLIHPVIWIKLAPRSIVKLVDFKRELR